jgi:hypothetical protein
VADGKSGSLVLAVIRPVFFFVEGGRRPATEDFEDMEWAYRNRGVGCILEWKK